MGRTGSAWADMLGNVWEWTEDCWHRNYGGAPSDGSAWVTRGGCRKRVLRGGSWNDEPRLLRSALRNWDTRGNRTSRHGFRVTRTLGNPGRNEVEDRMKHVRLLAWAVCAVLLPASVAWAQAPGRTAEQDDVFWESVLGCTSAVEVEMYISEFGEEGRHVAEARACLEKLGKAVPASGGKTAPPTEIERLLRVCEAHFAANRLTTGVGGTAVECYRKVQSLDPANREAVEGLQCVFGKYAAWARAALEKGDAGKARATWRS